MHGAFDALSIPSALRRRVIGRARLDDDRTCVLVLIGATEDGTKELLAVADGFRESKDSWGDLLRELKSHGLTRTAQAGHR